MLDFDVEISYICGDIDRNRSFEDRKNRNWHFKSLLEKH